MPHEKALRLVSFLKKQIPETPEEEEMYANLWDGAPPWKSDTVDASTLSWRLYQEQEWRKAGISNADRCVGHPPLSQ